MPWKKVGKDGVITVEDGKSLQTEANWIEGMQFDKGYPIALFHHQPNRHAMRAGRLLYFNPREKITTAKTLVPILEQISQSGNPS